MAITNITLTSAMRSNLLALQNTQSLFESTQTRLATGKKVNTALDNPIAYFAAKSYTDRASDLSNLKNDMNEAIQTLKAADAGITSLGDLISQAKSLAQSAMTTSNATEISSYADQFNEVLNQIGFTATDANYKGTNLLNGDNLTVNFNPDSTSSLTISGFTATPAADLNISTVASAASWDPNASITELTDASTKLRTESRNMSGNLAVVNTRLDFTTNMINTLNKGADNLTLADMNEEGANLLMLQTRQALGTTALSLASQAAQSVLRLF